MKTATTIGQLVSDRAAACSAAPALTAPGRTALSYEGLGSLVRATAGQLEALGAGGQCVAMVLPNGPEMAAAFLAVTTVATAAPLNPSYRAHEYDFYLQDLRPAALLVLDGSDSPALAVAESRRVPVVRLQPCLEAPAGTFQLRGAPDRCQPSKLAAAGDVALVLHTSGTTARPKLVPLTHRNLCASAANVHNALRLSPDDRCLNIMPLFHIHGLVAALLASLWAGGSVACAPGFVAPSFFDWLGECRPSWYTAVPTMHQAILGRAADAGGARPHAPLRFVRSSSSSLPPTVAEALERVFSAPAVEAYGMTEAAHQMCSNIPDFGLRRHGSVGQPAGPEVGILSAKQQVYPWKAAGAPTGPASEGEVVIRGPNVTAGYANNPSANAEAFVDGWFRTGDQGYFDADGYLHLTGRIKELINRGGEKIAPREVDEVLLTHPAVVQAVTFAMPDARLGEDVAAAVVLRPGANARERDLQAHAAGRLADFKVPRRIAIVAEIPKGATGKIQRHGLAEKLGLSGDRASTPATQVQPRSETERLVLEVWRAVLRRESFGVQDNFFQLGGDSVLAAQVLARLRQRWPVELPMLVFFESPTVAGLAAAVDRLMRAQPAAQPQDVENMLRDIEQMSEEEAKRLLGD